MTTLFKDLTVKSKKIKKLSVILCDIGEGYEGDYNPEDPEDKPLLRFDVYKDGEQMDNGSYCTLLSVNDDRKLLKEAAEIILKEAEESLDNGGFKRSMEQMSYLYIKNGKVKS